VIIVMVIKMVMCLNKIQSIVLICLATWGLIKITWTLIIILNDWNQRESIAPK